MATATLAPEKALAPDAEKTRSLADLVEQLGGVALARVHIRSDLGKATETDVIAIHAREGRLCELVDGVLVEKAMGLRESLLACALIGALRAFVIPRRLGLITGEAGTMRLFPGQIRIPDVAFASWRRLPGGVVPMEPIPDLVPDLVIEVLSDSNTKAEMARKRRDYFGSGVLLVWEVDPPTRTIAVFDSPEHSSTLTIDDALDGGEILPGFVLPLRELFEELDIGGPARPAS